MQTKRHRLINYRESSVTERVGLKHSVPSTYRRGRKKSGGEDGRKIRRKYSLPMTPIFRFGGKDGKYLTKKFSTDEQ
jgi:hypothetical protein